MRPTTPFRVRLAQIGPRLGDLDTNLALHLQIAEQAVADGIDLLIFPELSLTGYYLRDLTSDIALNLQADRLAPLFEASRKLDIVCGLVEETDACSVFASAVYLAGGEVVHCHRKVYLPTYGMFDEGRYLSPGHSVRAFDTRFGRMGLLVCEDIWHPVLPYLMAQDGMQYLLVVSNSPSRGADPEGLAIARTYEAMLGTYANLFQSYVLFCNRTGYEDGVNFWGQSRVVSPNGKTVACGPLLETALVDARIDPAEIRRARVAAPLVEEENVDLALRELRRISDERA